MGTILQNAPVMRLGLALLTVAASLVSTAARADTRGSARAHFSAAEQAYREGHYRTAVAELRAGFALDRQPAYRVALAQAYLKSGQASEALEQCRLYLASDTDPELTSLVHSLEKKLRRRLDATTTSTDRDPSPSPTETAALASSRGRALPSPPVSPFAENADDGAATEGAAIEEEPSTDLAPTKRPSLLSPTVKTRSALVITRPAPSLPDPSPPSWWSAHRRTAILVIVSVAIAVGVGAAVIGVEAGQAPSSSTTLGMLHF